ncbi:MAG: GNAT family N-acetyltransferase [Gemmatimonadaceae bacterium]
MLQVRPAERDDSAAIARLCTQLGYPAQPSDIPARLAQLSDDPAVRALVAVDDGSVVGLITTHARHTMNHPAPLAQITLLVVDETCRGRGIGRALVAAAEDWARENGCKRIVVTTALRRAGAHAFYESVNYVHTGRRYGKDFAPGGH